MFHQLSAEQYEKVRPIVSQLAVYNASIPALLDGINPGQVYVDDPETPTAAYLETVEGNHLAGDAANTAFVGSLNAYFHTHYYSHAEAYLDICLDSDRWDVVALFAPRTSATASRRHYLCSKLVYDGWKQTLPEGFAVRRIDDALLDDASMDIPGHIRGWINNNWGSREHYALHGFGFCTLHGTTVVSWSLADCATRGEAKRCEIGIQTRPEYRRQGLAAITAAAAVEYALNNGFAQVGWHCNADNEGSWKTAEKVGFHKERDYTQDFVIPDKP